jgi:hypothetical protein
LWLLMCCVGGSSWTPFQMTDTLNQFLWHKKIFIADMHDDVLNCRIFCSLTCHQGGPLQNIMQHGTTPKNGSQAKMRRYTDKWGISNDVN